MDIFVFIITTISSYLYFSSQRKIKGFKHQLKLMATKEAELALLKRRVKSLLWNIAHQQEKVRSNLNTLIPTLKNSKIPDHPEFKRQVIDDIMGGLSD